MRYAPLLLCAFTALPAVSGCSAPPRPVTELGESIAALQSIETATAEMSILSGFVPIWWQGATGKVFLELPPPGSEFLYWVSLPWGLGSNDIGLDRGQIGGQWLLRTMRLGNRVLLVAPNSDWRSSSSSPAVLRAVRESFAESVLFGFEIEAETDGRMLVDATEFLLRDAHRVSASLASSDQGDFSIDVSRSTVLGNELAGFPDNCQVDALLTFVGDKPGGEVVSTAADAHSVSIRIRHNFVRLPEAGFELRAFHPRSGFWDYSWNDLSAELDAPITVQHLVRHRLQKRDPSLESSPPLKPIVYYIDRGAPEPIRTALLEGARYWEPVFEQAGFPGGFRAELLPVDADPHDVRYNIVQWVNRSTRGWSYGNTVTDPRTGEILKGHVTLGALRVRQDVLLAKGLLSGRSGDSVSSDERSIEMALARIRQLAAHEIGHTLGLAHNFAASTKGRASVMDYPAPKIGLGESGELDLSDAYRNGCGEWDELAIRYGYSEFGHLPGGEQQGLAEVLAEAQRRGIPYFTDRDARGNDRAHPLANLWDNGEEPVAYLEHELEVRRVALDGFGVAALRDGQPIAELEEVLIPVYLHHRYQLEAAIRSLGGVEYEYELHGEGEARGTRPVAIAIQEQAFELALATLQPEFLLLPESVRSLIPARPPGSPGHRELQHPGALLLDPAELAAASIEITLALLLDPVRAARLAEQQRRDPGQVSWERVISRLVELTETKVFSELRSILEALRKSVLRHLMAIAADEGLPTRVSEPANRALHDIADRGGENSLERDLLRRYFEDPTAVKALLRPGRIPPGSPIGCGYGW